jgi:phosphoribosylformylglycinamidine synthase
LKVAHDLVQGVPPQLNLDSERALQKLLVSFASAGLLRSAHDCAEGGVGVTLAECAFGTGGMGFEADLAGVDAASGWEAVTALFSESASRVVVSVSRDHVDAVLARAADNDVPARTIGRTGGRHIRVSINGVSVIDIAVADAELIWNSALERHFKQRAA